MQTVKNILIIIALGLLVWILADALNIPGKVAQIITPTQETPTAPDLAPLVVIPPTLAPTPLPMPTPWTPVPTAPPMPAVELAATAPPVVTQAGELEVVTLALRNSERVAAACLDAWVADAQAGRVPQNCAGALSQVNALTAKQYELLTEGR
jgi:hypothetical protein